MKKKILITRKLLRSNEDRASNIWDAKLNSNDQIYSKKKLIEFTSNLSPSSKTPFPSP